MNRAKVKYLANCKGVFQGGGCKAVAYVGAYKEALAHGVTFSEFAGTSAGSIVAAFIAAGASPAQLEQIISSIDEKQFTNTAFKKKSCFVRDFIIRVLLKLIRLLHSFPITHQQILNGLGAFQSLGYYDSSSIRSFVEENLKRILNLETEVRFSDLLFPLTIVASDVTKHQVKVWSNEKTPNASVSFAVQCSCSVPFAFAPVNNVYVDGGLLCNLPVIFFQNHEVCLDKILAFSLTSNNSVKKKNKQLQYVQNLVSTVVEGSTEIQKSFKDNVYVIPIKVDLELLDFDKLSPNSKDVKTAIQQGESAVRSFMKKEEYKRKMLSFTSMFHLDQKEQIRTFVSYQSFDKNERVVVSLPNLEWSWELFLSILKWKNDGSKIDIYFENRLFQSGKRSDSLKEKVRIRTLSYMGINLHLSIKSLPSYGYFFQKNGNWSAVVINELIDRNKVKAKVLSEESDSAIIQTLVQSLNNHETRSFEPKNITNIALCPIDEGVILSCLKTIPIYKDADMAFEDIEVNQVFFMTRYVLGYKFRMMDVLVHSYGNESIFGAAAFEFAERQLSYIGPPVVEYCNEKYVIINGNTRFLYAYKNNIKTIRTVVVRNVNTPLMTCKRYTQSQMSVSDNLMKAETRYGEWDYAKYRPIEQAVRPYKTYLK